MMALRATIGLASGFAAARFAVCGVAACLMIAGASAQETDGEAVKPAPPAASDAATPSPSPSSSTASPEPSGPPPDLAFGAFQRGLFLTALEEALKRVKENPNDAPAMTLLGELYRDGVSVRRNLAEAMHWYKLAADRGDRQAQFALGIAHLNGAGAAKDRKVAQDWLEKAAAQNHAGALYNLGVLAIDAELQDFPRASELFRKAAELGDLDAAYGLAVLYREGTGVPRDKAESVKWLKRAADERHIAAMVEYAIVLFNGDGAEKSEAGAAKLFAKAAQANSPIAQNRLARLYAAGRGVKVNAVEAMKWHILARANGVKDDWLDSRLVTLSPPERLAVEEAVQRYIGN
ncbi:MAG: SEL1-like repeat protein [Beijerinckiaceae bacterium]|nr:SEL1-like repeat protein [Beijerinckiaceae bacterium]